MAQQLREYLIEYEDEYNLEIKELSNNSNLTPNHLDMVLYTQDEVDAIVQEFRD